MRLDELRFGIVQPDCRGMATRAHPPPTGRAYHRHMLLVIDAGNSHVTVGLARDGDLIASRRAASRASATPDELEVLLEGLLRLDGQGLAGAAAVAIASTVPALTDAFEAIAARREIPCAVASAGTIPMAVHVDRPGDVGPDRLVNAYAAAHLLGTPVIVVDCGTATTFDAVDSQGAFVGGAIAPGLQLGLEALATRTARLPLVELRLPDGMIGRDTASAIRVGTVLGHRTMIEGILGHIRRELAAGAGIAPHEVRGILTGGLSALPWARTIEGLDGIDPDLTLKGLIHFHRSVTGDEAQA
jgi:type III pantothenate kinase